MRINKLLALATGMSRRAADKTILAGRLRINGRTVSPGHDVLPSDQLEFDRQPLDTTKAFDSSARTTVMLNKPVGFVVSREGQGSKTVYELLPEQYQHLKPIGRLDRNSSGLLLLTDDGYLANELTHPSRRKIKIYQAELDKPLTLAHKDLIEQGITLEDGRSALKLTGQERAWIVTMHEGRNRQIRRTFAALGYRVNKLHRTQFGDHDLGNLALGKYLIVR